MAQPSAFAFVVPTWKKIRRKNTHLGDGSSLVDFNRSGIPLLEIVTEPDIHSAEEAEAFGRKLRSILQYLGVNTGDMSKGVLRMEPNISVRPMGSDELLDAYRN